MGNINVNRLLIGGVLAGLICFIGDGFIHGALLAERWAGVMTALGRQSTDFGRQHPGYFAAYDLLKGLIAVAIYAGIRPRFGPGAATALIAAVAVWLLVIPIPLLGLSPMEFFSAGFAATWAAYGIIPVVVATLAGAWLYREAEATAG
ncbi:MAG: hypothetical protein JO166_08995 [Deltaproteobacteria bacterium]|nr:hypothetical protein [Deltaproteobacteria bacterium]